VRVIDRMRSSWVSGSSGEIVVAVVVVVVVDMFDARKTLTVLTPVSHNGDWQ